MRKKMLVVSDLRQPIIQLRVLEYHRNEKSYVLD